MNIYYIVLISETEDCISVIFIYCLQITTLLICEDLQMLDIQNALI